MALNKQLHKANEATCEAITRARNGGESMRHVLEELELALPHIEQAFRYSADADDSD